MDSHQDTVESLLLKIQQFNHDVRSPLSVIQNELELLAMEHGEGCVAAAKNALRRVTDILSDLPVKQQHV